MAHWSPNNDFAFSIAAVQQISALFVAQQLDGPFVRARQREPTIRLTGIGVLEEENLDARGLFLRFPAQTAWRASSVSGRVTSQVQVTMSARTR